MIIELKTVNFEIDDIDYEKVSTQVWYEHRVKNNIYVKSPKVGYLHRYLISPPNDMVVDHINGNGLDNRRANLRIVTRSQNNMNRKPNTGKTKGVHFENSTQMWRATIEYDGNKIKSKRFHNKEDAIEQRKFYEIKYYGDFAGSGTAGLNF